jgi:hypothetical protein
VFAVFCAPYIVMMLFVNAIDFFFISFFSELFWLFFLYTLWEERRRMIRKALLVSLFLMFCLQFCCFVSAFVYFDGWWLLFAIKEFDLIVFV